MNFIYDTVNHRIGDKIVLEACFRHFKLNHSSSDKIVLVDDRRRNHPANELELDLMFGNSIDVYHPSMSPLKLYESKLIENDLFSQLPVGNLWLALPELRKIGIYPRITIPLKWQEWYSNYEDFAKLTHPIICIHILDNPPYNKARKHNYIDFEKIAVYLAKKGYSVVRIGRDNSQKIDYPNVLDVTSKLFSIMASIAIINKCDIFIGGDTGVTHIAAALNKKIIAIYGPNDHDKAAYGEEWDSYPNTADQNITTYIMKENFIEGTMIAFEAARFLNVGIGKGYEPVWW